MKPIRPEEVGEKKATTIPDYVIEAFNAEIICQCVNGIAIVKQNAVMERITNNGYTRQEIFDNGWLNVEDAYRDAGWKVEYHAPGYNESGEPFFIFRKKL